MEGYSIFGNDRFDGVVRFALVPVGGFAVIEQS